MQVNNWLLVARALLGRTYYEFNEGKFVATVLNEARLFANTANGVWPDNVIGLQKVVHDVVKVEAVIPGDLLFWGLTQAPYHVAIYVGGGQFIHASEVDNVIKIQSMQKEWYPSFAGRVR